MTRATVLLGTYNRLEILRRCVQSVLGQGRERYDLVVADAGSTDGTLEYLASEPAVRLVRDSGRLGQARSLNQAAALVQTEYLCWISDDNILRPKALDIAISAMDEDPEIGLVALKVKDITGPQAQRDYLGGVADTGILNVNQGMIRSSVFRDIGGFDETLRDYFIDVELATQVLLRGHSVVYTKSVAIDHYRDHDTDNWIDSSARAVRLRRNQAYYHLRHPALIGERKASRRALTGRIKTGCLSLLRQLSRLFPSQNAPCEQDWENLCTARFLSVCDFLHHARKPYYLRQKMSAATCRRGAMAVQQPTMEAAEEYAATKNRRERTMR